MDFAIGQNVWVLTGYDPTLNWEQGVVVKHHKGSFSQDTYYVAVIGGLIITDIGAYNKDLEMFVIQPFFVSDPNPPMRTDETKFVRSVC